jgi:hypothetical protein
MSRTGWILAGLTLALHLAVAGRYDFYRDELYFIICGRHPAFGYVDQPPLIPLLAAASQAFGQHLQLLRLLPALAAAGAVGATTALTRLLGGRVFSQLLAGVAVALAPVELGLTSTLNTTSFEPLTWTLVALFFARLVLLDDRRALLWIGAVTGIALEMKYSIAFYAGALAIGTALTPQRRVLRYPELLGGVAIALALGLPSVLWQAAHHWPFAELLAAAPEKNARMGPAAFWIKQIAGWNPVFAPVWAGGAIALLALPRLRPVQPLGIAFAIVATFMMVTPSKDYYLAGLFPAMFAAGATLQPRLPALGVLRWAYLAAGLPFLAVALPLAYPILDPPALAAHMQRFHLSPPRSENNEAGEVLPQHLGDQLGWREFEAAVARAYAALPSGERGRAAIVTSNYGEAAALDFYGAKDGLPPALSGHNSYYLWGTHGYDGSVILRVNGDPDRYAKLCRESRIVGRFGASPFVLPLEHDRPIVLCRGFHAPFPQGWAGFKHYD